MIGNLIHRARSSAALRTAIAGYFQIASVALASLIAVPLALHFLDREEFGLWIFTKQSIAYVILLDLGVGSAVGRLMGGAFSGKGDSNRWFNTLFSVMLAQAALMLLVGWLFIDPLIGWFEIPQHLKNAARQLWLVSLVGTAMKHCGRVLDGVLFAQNRVFWASFTSGIGAWLELVLFAILLLNGVGVYSYAWAFLVFVLCSIIGTLYGVLTGPWHLRFQLSMFDRSALPLLFGFSLKLFVLGAVAQVVFLSQTLIAAKILGLVAAGSYSVCMKLSLLARQLVARLYESHIPGWQKIFLEGRLSELRGRWRHHLRFVVGITIFSAVAVAGLNSIFVTVWAERSLNEGTVFDVLAAWFLLAHIWTGAMVCPLIFKMELNARMVLALVQLAVTVTLCVVLAKPLGNTGIILGALLGNLTTVFWFNTWKGAQILGEHTSDIWKHLLRPNLLLLVGLVASSILLPLAGAHSPFVGGCMICISLLAFWHIHRHYILQMLWSKGDKHPDIRKTAPPSVAA